MPKKRISDRNTKAEILSAYSDLAQRERELQAQLREAEKKNEDRAASTVVTVSPSAPEPLPSLPFATAKLSSMDEILQGLELLQVGFGGAISSLSENLTQEATQLEALQTDVDRETEQLETLHEIEPNETSLDALVAQYS